MPEPLTPRQREIYDWMLSCFQRHGIPPTTREVMKHFEMKSPNAVHCHFAALHRKGWIEVYEHTARGIRFLVNGKNDKDAIIAELLETCKAALRLCEGNGYAPAFQDRLKTAIANAEAKP